MSAVALDPEVTLRPMREQDIEAVVAQSQKRSAVYDIVTNPTVVEVETRV